MKTTIRIAALMLLVIFSASGSKPILKPPCNCPDVYDPACDATGRVYSNACQCRCQSSVPGACVGGC